MHINNFLPRKKVVHVHEIYMLIIVEGEKKIQFLPLLLAPRVKICKRVRGNKIHLLVRYLDGVHGAM